MDHFIQSVHQNNIILTVGFIFLSSLVFILWMRTQTKRRLAVWLTLLAITAVMLLWLRTPPATVSETNQADLTVSQTNLDFGSVAEIESYLTADDKPTLVEFYSDFGFS